MKTSELQGAALDWAVATCEGVRVVLHDDGITRCIMKLQTCSEHLYDGRFEPTTNWSQGGPIIEREGIAIRKGTPLYFPTGNENGDYYKPLWLAGKQHGPTPLIAATRCYVASKLGDEVEIPEGLK
jgi:hypothetical protein